MVSILDRIVTRRRETIDQAKRVRPMTSLEAALSEAPPVRDFVAALRAAPGVALIAEIKKASPSRGLIRPDFRPLKIAEAYQEHGASAISVLTEPDFFEGRLEYLTQVRHTVALPVLRKDFVIDAYQMVEARVAGADAVLLIAECLETPLLRDLFQQAVALGMTPLVELYEEANLERVLELEPSLVGINSRDLRTFEVDLDRTIALRQRVPKSVAFVAESGIWERADVERLEAGGIDAMLVGEALMRSPDVGAAVRRLVGP